jgi:hypothetical protein
MTPPTDESGGPVYDSKWMVWSSDYRTRFIVGRLDLSDNEQHDCLLAFDDERAAHAVAATLNAFGAVRP